MDLIVNKNSYWSFPWYQMEEQIKTCGGKKWDNMEEIEEYIKSLNGFYVVGYISEETARK